MDSFYFKIRWTFGIGWDFEEKDTVSKTKWHARNIKPYVQEKSHPLQDLSFSEKLIKRKKLKKQIAIKVEKSSKSRKSKEEKKHIKTISNTSGKFDCKLTI